MKKLFLNSHIQVCTLQNFAEICVNQSLNIIQFEELRTDDNLMYYVVEFAQKEEKLESLYYNSNNPKSQEQMNLETALDTILNNDPKGKYNDCALRKPFDLQDKEWIEWVLANMRNKYIRDKVQLIKDSGYGNLY